MEILQMPPGWSGSCTNRHNDCENGWVVVCLDRSHRVQNCVPSGNQSSTPFVGRTHKRGQWHLGTASLVCGAAAAVSRGGAVRAAKWDMPLANIRACAELLVFSANSSFNAVKLKLLYLCLYLILARYFLKLLRFRVG